MKRLFVIGDSTVCLFNDSTYFYPRYGYGTQLEKYLNDFEVINLALSGRSSKSCEAGGISTGEISDSPGSWR